MTEKGPAKGLPPKVVGTCLAFMFLLAVLVGMGFVMLANQIQKDAAPAVAQAKSFIAEVAKGEVAAAHSRLSTSMRAKLDLATFEKMIAADPGVKDFEAWTLDFPEPRLGPEQIVLKGTLQTKKQATKHVLFQFVREGEAWKIASFGIEDAPISDPVQGTLSAQETARRFVRAVAAGELASAQTYLATKSSLDELKAAVAKDPLAWRGDLRFTKTLIQQDGKVLLEGRSADGGKERRVDFVLVRSGDAWVVASWSFEAAK